MTGYHEKIKIIYWIVCLVVCTVIGFPNCKANINPSREAYIMEATDWLK